MGWVKPALQVQFWWDVLPGADVEKAGHCWQTPSPDPALNWLAPHPVHAPPSGPMKPALQAHPVILSLAAGELESAGQLLQQSTWTFFKS